MLGFLSCYYYSLAVWSALYNNSNETKRWVVKYKKRKQGNKHIKRKREKFFYYQDPIGRWHIKNVKRRKTNEN